jgi:hypothetical protein
VAPAPPATDDEVPPHANPNPWSSRNSVRPYDLRLGGGWQLTFDNNGAAFAQRVERTRSAGLWGTGLAIWLTTYFVGSITATMFDDYGAIHWAPFFGAFGIGVVNLADNNFSQGLGYMSSALLQMGGFAMMIAGLAGNKTIRRIPVQIAPYGSGDGGGLSFQGRF